MRVGKILLISCYELGHPPMGLTSPLGRLKAAGYNPVALDLSVQAFDHDKVQGAIFAGISVPMHTALRMGLSVARQIRKINPTCHICFFGLYASLNAPFLLDEVADSVVGGEYETPLLNFVERYTKGESLAGLPGISVKGAISPPLLTHPPKGDLAHPQWILPDRALLPPPAAYAHLEEKGLRRPAGYVEATHGCRHLCRHCPIPAVYQGRYLLVPKEGVLADIVQQVDQGVTHMTFGDPDFLNAPVHSQRIVRAMHDQFPEITFDFTAKIEHVLKHRALIREWGGIGCRFMISAVESLSDVVLAHLEKGHTRTDVVEAIRITREAGIPLRPSLVPFTPWSTLADYFDLLCFVKQEGLIHHVDPVQYTIRLLIPPGSLLLADPTLSPHLHPLIPETFSHPWTHPDARMDLLQKKVRAEVERGTKEGKGTETIFNQIVACALAVDAERDPVPVPEVAPSDESATPRMSEPWFCCAEPTETQMLVAEE